ncbi:Uncharacterised protein [Klebsiella pneumoniae]|uniref:Uncharacterized protein n=1 Tax=Klebsiella pneumoniae TaxID=573 RepID=A0A447RPN8_KLEPN|nr:Uncharacterised protein [Klebsiella pneumoniae]
MLKPGELLMQLHHFAYHQQGGHRGVFRQVFELLQCAGYRLLIVTGATEITATGVSLSRPWAISWALISAAFMVPM